MRGWALANAAMVLLSAEIVLVWTLANYALPELRRQRRTVTESRAWTWIAVGSVLAGVASFWLGRHASLAAWMLVGCAAVPWMRSKVAAAYMAEFELAANALFVAMALKGVAWLGATPRHLGHIPDNKGAALLMIAAILIFAVRGGTNIVRGMLDKVGTLPPLEGGNRGESEFAIDVKEYNRGRLIGSIERILLVAMVAVHSYEALGFLIAAKGLIRSRELENRSWAEYFLVGTLASTLVAVVAGLAIQCTIKALW